MAENHRGDKRAPFSERQTAIYHQYKSESDQSTWIILQASCRARICLRDFKVKSSNTTFSDQVRLHVVLLLDLANTWREYINFLEDQLVELVESPIPHFNVDY